MKSIRFLHAVWTGFMFGFMFILLLPFFLIPIFIASAWRWTSVLNRIWAKAFYTLSFFPTSTEYRFDYKPSDQYIFCPNHFSYLDIPAMGLNKIHSIFVGKSDMEKIPLFGWMYKNLHITVNRSSLKSRYQTLLSSKKAIDEGKSLMIFPEGGIVTKSAPQMSRFKDGAFRTAIEKQIPIVPVTIPNNWIILPDGQWLTRLRTVKVIFHEPILTKNMSIEDIAALKDKTYAVIDAELKKTTHESKSRTS